jgi:YspA, cpYpsA-related SLOG family
MRVVICGGRDYQLTAGDRAWLDTLCQSLPITEVITGGGRGVDAAVDLWARRRGLVRYVFPPAWEIYGRAAGPRRNEEMARFCGPQAACIAFPGGLGTADMVRRARQTGLAVYVRWTSSP